MVNDINVVANGIKASIRWIIIECVENGVRFDRLLKGAISAQEYYKWSINGHRKINNFESGVG